MMQSVMLCQLMVSTLIATRVIRFFIRRVIGTVDGLLMLKFVNSMESIFFILQLVKIQMQGVATASLNTDFNREDWTQACDKSILYPECDWEGECIEGASIVKKDNKLYMFYAGAYNNAPQQIGVAVSEDGLNWKRLSEEPFLRNGKPGEWNSSESGHPHLFTDLDGRTYLFYQGNNDHGKTWYITQQEVLWKDGKPYLK